MKTLLIDFESEFDLDDKITAKSLIGKGYFPQQLTPNFTTKLLSEYSEELKPVITSMKNTKNEIEKNKKFGKVIKFSYPKSENYRRDFSVTHPLHQSMLTFEIENNLNQILEFCNKSKYSLTKLKCNYGNKRAINTPIDDINIKKITLASSSKFVLKTDISRFYYTIYTHTIPWALHTKEFAKLNRGNDYLGNLLDELIRNTQDAQTLGIPVGPDTSHVISEIIGTAIDLKIEDKFPDIPGFRFRDDFYFYTYSKIEAEKLLSTITKIFKSYELDINPEKTMIMSLPQEIEPIWISELRLYAIRENEDYFEKNLISYITKVYDYMNTFEKEPVLKYALKKIRNTAIPESKWYLVKAILLNAITIEPSLLPMVFEMFNDYSGFCDNEFYKLLEINLNNIIDVNLEFDYSFEVLWGLWGLKYFGLNLKNGIAQTILNSDSPLILLVLLDLYDKNLIIMKDELDLSTIKNLMIAESLYSENWILVYEAITKGWLKPKNGKDFIVSDPFFNFLKSKNITFYIDKKEDKLPDLDKWFDWDTSY